jgi:DNA-binding beta-propeller fold protein YncE
MPWLMVHLTIPWLLLGAWFTGRVLEDVDWRGWWRRGGAVVLVLAPLAIFGLVSLLRFRPFSSVSLSDLNQTMRWIGALIILAIAGGGLFLVGRRLGWKAMRQSIFITLAAALYLLTARFSIMATHTNINYVTEWIGYAHSTPDPVRVIREVEDLSRRYSGDLSMPVAYDDDTSWPFAWYFRNFTNATFYGKKPNQPFDQPVVLVGSANEQEVKPYLGDDYYRFDERLIWWPLEVYKDFNWENLKRKLPPEQQPPPPAEGEKEQVPIVTYLRLLVSEIREQRQDPAKRQTLWNVIWHRKFQESTDSWPLVHRFALYVRKDVANQLWDLNVGPAAPETLPQDPYADLYRTLGAVHLWGSQGKNDGQFTDPRDVAVDPAGFVYVADSGNHRIQKFDLEGNHLLTWGSQGSGPGQFQEPWGVAIDDQGRVYVADTWNHRVQVFDGDGTFLRQWGAHAQVQDLAPDTAKLFWGPRDIAIDDQERVFVTDTGNKRVQVFTTDGEFLTMFGGFGIEPGQMNEPVGLAAAADGHIYLADTWNRRVQVFDADLAFLKEWDIDGWWGESVVNKPYLTVDETGYVYVTDPEGYRVLIFNDSGQPLTAFGQIGADDSSFNLPIGVAVDEEGYIYVTDAGNHRIMKFAPLSLSVD